jgi:hypothetical protein
VEPLLRFVTPLGLSRRPMTIDALMELYRKGVITDAHVSAHPATRDEERPLVKWDWAWRSHSASEMFVWRHPREDWDWDVLSARLDPDAMFRMRGGKWNWKIASRSPKFKAEHIALCNPSDLDWDHLSEIIDKRFIDSHPDLPWRPPPKRRVRGAKCWGAGAADWDWAWMSRWGAPPTVAEAVGRTPICWDQLSLNTE